MSSDAVALPEAVEVYDTTLRDGSQLEGLSLTVEDKLRVAEQLDWLGVHYIEGGWPGANPKDDEFFRRVHSELQLDTSTLVAFGSTRRKAGKVDSDDTLRHLLEANTGAVCIVAWAASARTPTAGPSPGNAERSTWCARSTADAPRTSNAAAARACAVSRQLAPADWYAALRTSGWRYRYRPATVSARTRSRSTNRSTAATASAGPIPATAATRPVSKSPPATNICWRCLWKSARLRCGMPALRPTGSFNAVACASRRIPSPAGRTR